MAFAEFLSLIRRSSHNAPTVAQGERRVVPMYKLYCPSVVIDSDSGKPVPCGLLAGPTADTTDFDTIAQDHMNITAKESYKNGKLVYGAYHCPTIFFVDFQ